MKRIPRVAIALVLALVLPACVSKKKFEESQKQNAQLSEEKKHLESEVASVGAANTEAQATLDEVQKNLEELRTKELKVLRSSIQVIGEGKPAASKREGLLTEIESLRKAIRDNLDKLATLEKQKKSAEARAGAAEQHVTTLERLVSELRASLQEKESTIAELEQKVQGLVATTEELRGTVKQKEEQIVATEAEAAKAYVLIATKDALKKAGLVKKEGSVLGLGGGWKPTGKYDEELFRQIDVRQEVSFAIGAPVKKARVLSNHPADSYSLEADGEKAATLKVLDPARFWQGSRYLVVMMN